MAKACKSPLSHCSTYTTSFMSHHFLEQSLRLHLVNSFFPSTLHKLCLPALSLHPPLLSRDSHVTSYHCGQINHQGLGIISMCNMLDCGSAWPRQLTCSDNVHFLLSCCTVEPETRDPPRYRDNLSTKDTCLNPMLKYFSAISPPR